VWGGCCDPQGLELFDGGGHDPTTSAWRPLPQGPLAPRQLHTAVWTGDRMVVWGGRAGLADYPPDVAAYVPAEDAWARMRRGPLIPRAGHTALWTGDRMIVWGGCCTPAQDGYADGAELVLPASSPVPSPAPVQSVTPSPTPEAARPESGESGGLIPAVMIGLVVLAVIGALLVSRWKRRRG